MTPTELQRIREQLEFPGTVSLTPTQRVYLSYLILREMSQQTSGEPGFRATETPNERGE